MEPTDPVAFIRYYNAWRVGGDMDMPEPSKITRALTELCDKVEHLERELEQERQDRVQAEKDVCRALGERNDARAEVALWKKRIVPFLAVHAGNYGKDHYGENCLHFTHYDMLAEAGGRMDDFKRCGDPEQP